MRLRTVLALFLIVAALPSFAQNVHDDRMAVLKFGIESEELEVVRALRQEGSREFMDQLKETYTAARSDDLKQQILLLFSDLKDGGLEDQVLKDLGDTTKGNTVLLTIIGYLADLKSTKAVEPLMGQTSASNKVIASASIRALGKLGAVDKADDLIKFYKDGETDPNLKPDLIWAFGEMKAETSVDLLTQEYDDNDSQPLLRKTILEALGKIGGDKAWDTVSKALADSNGDIRAAAVGAMGSFGGRGDTVAILTSALRDSQVGVRLAGAQAAKTLKDPGLKDLLVYRMRKDPDPKVRTAALQAVAAYDDGPSSVLAVLGDTQADVSVWRDALNLALDKNYAGTAETLRKVLENDSKDKFGTYGPMVAAALLAKRDSYRGLFGQELASDKASVRGGALRAIQLGKYTEYSDKLKTMAASDPDPGVKAQADAILKDWNKPAPSPSPTPAAPAGAAPTATPAPVATPAPATK
jgi:HEAT repeat protein